VPPELTQRASALPVRAMLGPATLRTYRSGRVDSREKTD
jgi:hypothetical protein